MALKRALGTLTAIVLTAALAAGCGKAETAPQEAQNAPAETQEQAEEAVPEAEAGQEAAEGTENGDAETATAETEEPVEEAPAEDTASVESFPETVLFDRDGVKVTVEGFGMNNRDERTMKVTLSNNTSSDVTIKDIDAITDGYVNKFYMSEESASAPAGETVTGECHINRFALNNAGIISIHEMSLIVNLEGDALGDSTVSGEQVTIVTNSESVMEERDMSLFRELHNEDGLVILAESKAHLDPFGSAKLYILFENNTDDAMLIEPIIQFAGGGSHGGHATVAPHAKYATAENVHEGDTYFVRISLVEGPYQHTKLFETEEIAVEMP